MADKGVQAENVRLLAGCGILVAIAGMALLAILGLALSQDRNAARYPGSLQVTSHSRYDLPYRYRWDDVYRTSDPFNAVYNWYSVGFELGAESKAMGSCILLEGSSSQLTAQRIMTVFLCDTPAGRSIYVTRSTSLR